MGQLLHNLQAKVSRLGHILMQFIGPPKACNRAEGYSQAVLLSRRCPFYGNTRDSVALMFQKDISCEINLKSAQRKTQDAKKQSR